jgi:hypothetical protein
MTTQPQKSNIKQENNAHGALAKSREQWKAYFSMFVLQHDVTITAVDELRRELRELGLTPVQQKEIEAQVEGFQRENTNRDGFEAPRSAVRRWSHQSLFWYGLVETWFYERERCRDCGQRGCDGYCVYDRCPGCEGGRGDRCRDCRRYCE